MKERKIVFAYATYIKKYESKLYVDEGEKSEVVFKSHGLPHTREWLATK